MLRLALLLGALAGPALAQHAERAPWCFELEPGDGGGVDCRLPGRAESTLFFDFVGGQGAWDLTFYEFSQAGDTLFKSGVIAVEGVVTSPELRDLNGDGLAELFVPYSAGMVNVYNEIWMARSDGWRRIGELGGFGAASLEIRDGLVVGTERSSAAVYYETARRISADGIASVYELEIDYAEMACRLTDDSGLAAAGLTAEDVLADCNDREWE